MNVINFAAKACERIRMQLDAHLNNELAPANNQAIVQHLERCQNCAATLAARLQVKQALQTAVRQDEAVPVALRDRILKDIQQANQQVSAPGLKPALQRGHRNWWLAAAAALLISLGGFGLIRLLNARAGAEQTLTMATAQATEQNAKLLKIGLGDHIHCASGRDYSAGPRSFERMAQDMGPTLSGLVPLVKERVPADYVVMLAHHCTFEGRSFIHLILSNQQTLLSLVLTQKNGMAFAPTDAGAIAQTAGGPLYQMRQEDRRLEIAGFETRDYLGYVVSGLDQQSNLQIAERLTPAVRDFLAKLES